MSIKIIAVGGKMPSWVVEGSKEYQKRLPKDFQITWLEIPLGPRSKSSSVKVAMEKEGQKMMAAINDSDFVIALEVKGQNWSTEKLAKNLGRIRDDGKNIVLIIGGPDGLHDSCIKRANLSWSLSGLTLPHPLVRVLLTEQIYRAWTVLNNHPYHK